MVLLLFVFAFVIAVCNGQNEFPDGCNSVRCPRCFKCVVGEKNYPNCVPPIGNDKCFFDRNDCSNLPCPPDTTCGVVVLTGAQCYGKIELGYQCKSLSVNRHGCDQNASVLQEKCILSQ